MDVQDSAEIVSVYRAREGGIHHARCAQRLVLKGRRTEELHFYCMRCVESMILPLCVLARIPLARGATRAVTGGGPEARRRGHGRRRARCRRERGPARGILPA